MKVFAAAGIVLLISMGAFGQRRAPMSAPPPAVSTVRGTAPLGTVRSSGGALGGSFASIGISRPLGGIAPSSSLSHRKTITPGYGYRYVGPVYYAPNAYDPYYSSASSYSTFNTPANPALYYTPTIPPQSSSQPVIINQYFGSRGASSYTENGSTSTSEGTLSEAKPGDPIGAPQNYYLIAYKDRSIYSALAYWLEGDTLHYVTTQNTHNQASLGLIDLDQTTRLNADNAVPFSLGK